MPQLLHGNISILDTISPSEFQELYYKPKTPVILKTYTKNWKAIQLWTPEWFQETYKDSNIWVSPLSFGLSHPPNYEIKMTMSQFMDILREQQEEKEFYWVKKVVYHDGERCIATRHSDGKLLDLNGDEVSNNDVYRNINDKSIDFDSISSGNIFKLSQVFEGKHKCSKESHCKCSCQYRRDMSQDRTFVCPNQCSVQCPFTKAKLFHIQYKTHGASFETCKQDECLCDESKNCQYQSNDTCTESMKPIYNSIDDKTMNNQGLRICSLNTSLTTDVEDAPVSGCCSNSGTKCMPKSFGDNFEQAPIESKLGCHTIFYCQQCPTRILKNLTTYYPLPDLFDNCEESVFGANSFFIGGKGIRTSLHYDRPQVDNLFCQIYGKKRFRLYAPSERAYFYMLPTDSKYGHVSQIPEIDHVDLNQFPDFEKAKLYADIILEPGDSLYIPKGWHHHVEHYRPSWDHYGIADREKLSISLNFWYY